MTILAKVRITDCLKVQNFLGIIAKATQCNIKMATIDRPCTTQLVPALLGSNILYTLLTSVRASLANNLSKQAGAELLQAKVS